jgi:arsenate reductase
MSTKIYHNPRCSKSRQALQLLKENGIEPVIVEYLKTPPTAEELRSLLGLLGVGPLEILRHKEPRLRELGLNREDERDDAAWIDILVANPMLIERPIVVNGRRATIGRPPERVLNIL